MCIYWSVYGGVYAGVYDVCVVFAGMNEDVSVEFAGVH